MRKISRFWLGVRFLLIILSAGNIYIFGLAESYGWMMFWAFILVFFGYNHIKYIFWLSERHERAKSNSKENN